MGFFGEIKELYDGKNLAHFILIYIIGDTIRKEKESIDKIKTTYLWIVFAFINTGIVLFFGCLYETPLRLLWPFVDFNNGIVLIINAIVTFILFTRINLQSKVVNWLASSVLAIYILQQEPWISSQYTMWFSKVWNPDFAINCSGVLKTLMLVCYLGCRAIVFMILAIFIDKTFIPVWKLVTCLSEYISKKVPLPSEL